MSLHKRQRRGANIWQEPQEFAASGVAVDIPNGSLTFGTYSSPPELSAVSTGHLQVTIDGNNGKRFRISDFGNNELTFHPTLGRLSSSGDLQLRGNGIQFLPQVGYITKVGDAGTTSHGLSTNDDLLVTGQLEADGIAEFDDVVRFNSSTIVKNNLQFLDGCPCRFGSDMDLAWEWNDTAGLVDCVTGGGGPLALPAPTAAPTLQTASTMTFSVDETNDELDVTVKYSDGTVHTGTVTLV